MKKHLIFSILIILLILVSFITTDTDAMLNIILIILSIIAWLFLTIKDRYTKK